MDIQKWISKLRTMSKEVVDSKDDLNLHCPSIFKAKPDVDSFKCHACFVKADCLVLDFDNGDVSPDDFKTVFSSKQSTSGRHNFVIMNSWSRSEEQPNRFRVIMFFKQPARTVEEYRECFDYVVRRLQQAGFPAKTSGLDRCSRSPSQSFYFPGTNRSQQDFAFFENHWTKSHEHDRYAIDPHSIWATQPREFMVSKPKMSISSQFQQKARERADELKVVIMGKDEGRHHDQYLLAVELKKSGESNARIRTVLEECLGTEPRMTKKIQDTLDSLDRWSARH